jgi:hypothetical protein
MEVRLVLEKRVLFEDFEFPVVKGLEYLMDEENPTTDYLFINEPNEKFSMYFERGQNPFDVSQTSETDKTYCLFQIKRKNRTIHFYCPERLPNRESVMWYFYVEILDENGKVHTLPGQMRVVLKSSCLRLTDEKEQFIEILEQVKLTNTAVSA